MKKNTPLLCVALAALCALLVLSAWPSTRAADATLHPSVNFYTFDGDEELFYSSIDGLPSYSVSFRPSESGENGDYTYVTLDKTVISDGSQSATKVELGENGKYVYYMGDNAEFTGTLEGLTMLPGALASWEETYTIDLGPIGSIRASSENVDTLFTIACLTKGALVLISLA